MRDRIPRLVFGLAAVLVSLPFAPAVRGDEGKPAPAQPDAKGKSAPKAGKADANTGPEIAWARTFAEAKEEAAERNIVMFLHSHGST